MHDQHTRGIATTRHRNLVGRGGRKAFVRDKGLAHKKKCQQTQYFDSKKEFEHKKLPAELPDYFFRSQIHNINQSGSAQQMKSFFELKIHLDLQNTKQNVNSTQLSCSAQSLLLQGVCFMQWKKISELGFLSKCCTPEIRHTAIFKFLRTNSN